MSRPVTIPPARSEIAAVMAGVCVGRSEAIGRLWELSMQPLRRQVRRTIEGAGFVATRDLVHDASMDAFLRLVERAPAWRPDGGATPWHWASDMVRSVAFETLGIVGDDPDDHDDLAAVPCGTPAAADEDPTIVLDRLAADMPDVAVYRDRLYRTASPRDRVLHLRMAQERAAGNTRPSVTVAVELSMTQVAVRQADSRVARRLASAHPCVHAAPFAA